MFSTPSTGAIEAPRICVVIPSYNCAQWLERAVESAFAFCPSPKSVVVVDDGSTDHTPTVCAKLRTRFANLEVLVKPNGGLSSARNHGIDHAASQNAGEYLVLLDADDALLPMDLGPALASGCDMLRIGVEETVEGRDGSVRHVEYGGPMSGREYLRQRFEANAFYTPSCAYLYRLRWLRDTGLRFVDGLIHEDNLFTVQALMAARSVIAIPDLVYHYIRREGSITTAPARDKLLCRVAAYCQISAYLTAMANKERDFDLRWKIEEVIRGAQHLAVQCGGIGPMTSVLMAHLRYMFAYRGFGSPGVRYKQRQGLKDRLRALGTQVLKEIAGQ